MIGIFTASTPIGLKASIALENVELPQPREAGTKKSMSRRIMHPGLVLQRFPETAENFFAAPSRISPVRDHTVHPMNLGTRWRKYGNLWSLRVQAGSRRNTLPNL